MFTKAKLAGQNGPFEFWELFGGLWVVLDSFGRRRRQQHNEYN